MKLQVVIRNEGFKLTNALAVKSANLFQTSQNEAHTARQDWASFAVILLPEEDILLSTTFAPAFSPKANHVCVRVLACCAGLSEALVTSVGMVDDDDGMDKADILLSGDAFALRGKRAHQLRLSINVPEQAPPGRYSGTLRFFTHEFFGDEELVCSLDFFINVHDVLLPGIKDRKFHLDLWQHLSNIARKHETPLYSDAHFRVIEEYLKSMSALGQKAVTLIASEIPWSGQRCYRDKEYESDLFEYSMIQVTKGADGNFSYDYSAAERYIKLCFAYGIDREIEIFGLCGIWMDAESGYGKAAPDWPDGVRIRYFDESAGVYRYMHEFGEVVGYIAALQGFLESRGWLDIALVVADEPADREEFRRSVEAIRLAAPKFRFKAAFNHAEFIRECKDFVWDSVPVLPAVSTQWDSLNEVRSQIPGRLLYYVCCGPLYPNTFLCSPLAESRLLPLLAYWLVMDGFLRWAYTAWPEHPRERLTYRTGEWWSGDTCFVYPSRGGEPLLSLRYFALKRGVEDYELAAMVARLKDGQAVLEKVWDTVIRQKDIRQWTWDYTWGTDKSTMFSVDWESYELARLLMLQALESAER